MAADLVFAAGADNHIDHGGVGRWIILIGRILGCSRFAVQRDLNGTLGFFLSQVSENLRPVTFDDGSLLKQARQLAGRPFVMGHQHDAGGFPIQAVNRKGLAFVFKEKLHPAQQRAVISVGGALGQQAGRLEPHAVASSIADAFRGGRLYSQQFFIIIKRDLVP